MKTVSCASLVAAALAAGSLGLRAAESVKFRFATAVYADAKGAGLSQPEAVACGANGQFVVGDTGNDRLVRFTYADKVVNAQDAIKVPQLTAPVRVQLNSKGEIYALDGVRRKIVHLSPAGAFVGVVAFTGAPASDEVIPKGFAIDSADNLYVLDVFTGRVLVLDAQGQFQRALPLPAEIGFAADLAVDPSGSLFLVDAVKRRLYTAPKDATAIAPLGGDLTDALTSLPTAIVSTRGAILVVEGSGSDIVALGRDGAFLSRQLSQGRAEGLLDHPSQMCIDSRDDAFIADRDNSRIQIFQVLR
jgi:hypothetical protein